MELRHIEKLRESYPTDPRNSFQDFERKINEIIDVVNSLIELYERDTRELKG